MAERFQIFKCELCGNVTEIVEGHAGTLVCCNQPMKRLEENVTDGAAEKHVPVIEETQSGYLVKVGSVNHPMLTEHYIEFVELTADGRRYKAYLSPGEKPEFEFSVPKAKDVSAREYCNLHGLWAYKK